MNSAQRAAIDQVVARLSQRLNSVFESLERLRDAVEPVLAEPNVTHTRLATIEPEVRRLLDSDDGLITNAGVALAPGALSDVSVWMQSWHRSGADVRLTNHSLNPSSMSYYDYTDMEWFKTPSVGREPVLHGPYVDFGGVDARIITAAIPASEIHGNVSVIAADLALEELEKLLLRSLNAQQLEVAIVTDSGTVVASNSARLLVVGTITSEPEFTYPLAARSLPAAWRLVVTG